MIKEIKLPEVSDNVETGDVLKVLVNVGDKIEVDQPLVELETEKATFEVPSTESGVVKEINVKQGDVIRVGDVILKIETNGTENKENNKKLTSGEAEDPGKQESEAPLEDKKDNDVKSGEPKEIKKESESGKDGSVQSKEENNVKEIKEGKEKDTDTEKADLSEENKISLDKSAPASPSVRKLARELGVEISSVKGSGPGGRISESDVKDHVKNRMQKGTVSSDGYRPLPDFSKWGETDIQPMSKIRSLTAEAMSYAWTTIPMVTQFDKADITQLEEFRKNFIKKSGEGAHLTITGILVKVCEAALRNFPQFNSSIDFNKKETVYKKYFNIGVAADTDRGLLVPVIKNVDKKRISEISNELNELAEKARNKKITPEEMEGGNFTISNLGGIGGTNFTPIVYSPQVAILGVSRGGVEPKFINEKFEPRFILPLSLTYDHRIIDGADAARFLRWICESLENPMMMFL